MTTTPETVIAEAVGSIKLSEWEDVQDRCVRSVTEAVHTALCEHGMLVEGDLTAAHCTSVPDTEESETPALPGDLTDETIERAARAVYADQKERYGDEITAGPGQPVWRHIARAALAAARVAPVTPSGAGALRQLGCMIVNCIDCGDAAIGVVGDTEGGARCEGCAYAAGKRDRPAPSPDREKLEKAIRSAEGALELAGATERVWRIFNIGDERSFTTHELRTLLAALAVPPVVTK